MRRAKRLQQLANANPRFADFNTLINEAKSLGFDAGGKNFTKTERDIIFGYIPSGREVSPEDFRAKLRLAQRRVPFLRNETLRLAAKTIGDVKKQLIEEDEERARKQRQPSDILFRGTTSTGKSFTIRPAQR